MKRRIDISLLALFFGVALFYVTLRAAPDATASGSSGQPVRVIVYLEDQADVHAVPGATRAERGRSVVSMLRAKADATQGALIGLLQMRRSQGLVVAYTPLWIINAIALTADRRVVDEIARLPQVSRVVPDETIQAPPRPPVRVPGSPFGPAAATAIGAEWNISKVNAPAMWALGFRGQGVVIASMDTGVDANHPDLQSRWRGGSDSWYDPNGQHATPWDNLGHGTWTMGVMVGDSQGGTSIGMAPDAQWIAVKIFNDSGIATDSAIHLGFQWLLAPGGNSARAPDVVNNSWDAGVQVHCVTTTFELDIQALIAAGITPVFAAGNYGAGGIPDPADNPGAFSVGSTDNQDLISPDSSRGTTTCGGGPARFFPDMVAPGVGIRTSDLSSLPISYTTQSGTSLAAPHVSGAMALLLSAYPSLTVSSQISAVLNSAVDLGTPGPDTTFGNGRLDVLAAYHWLLLPKTDLSLSKTASPTVLFGGDSLTYTLVVANGGPISATQVIITDSLPLSVSLLSASAGCGGSGVVTCTLGTVAAGLSRTVTITVQAHAAVQTTITNTAIVASQTNDSFRANNVASVAVLIRRRHVDYLPILMHN